MDIKSIITIVALALWVGHSAYGCYIGQFDTVFDFFKECFLMVISFYLGTKVKTEEVATEDTVEESVDVVPSEDYAD